MKALLFLCLLAASAVAEQVRVTVQVIEVPQGELTKWTTGKKLAGSELYDRALKLALGGGAEIVDTNVLLVRSGEKALAESLAEVMYPTEQEAADIGGSPLPLESKTPLPVPLRPVDFFSWETRNVGTIVEIEPTASPDNKLVDVRLSYETVDRAANATYVQFRDDWGDSSVRRPIFDTKRLSSAITVTAGAFELFNVFTPKPAAIPAATTRQLVFIRAEVLTYPKP